MWCEIIRRIVADMREPVGYIPWAFAVAAVIGAVGSVWLYKKNKGRKKRFFWQMLFAVYALVVIQLAFFSREPGSRDGINFVLFSTWGYTTVTHAFFVENILMFVPFGFLAPICTQRLRPMWRCVLSGFACSTLLELCQLLTKRGYCELDDVLTNTFGALVGWCLFRLAAILINAVKNKVGLKEEETMKYDYLVVGAGLYGAVFAQEARKKGKRVLVIDRRQNIAGNVYTEDVEGIHVHKYGAHIFHTNNQKVWEYITQFAEFNRFTNSPVANYKGELYSLPFNMYTFNKMWGVVTPQEAAAKIEEQKNAAGITEPKNLEEQAISLVGTDIYEKLIKGYTQKQWGRKCTELPAFIIKRLPVRFTFDNNYFNALYQGIPKGGYTKMVANLLEGTEVKLGVDYLERKEEFDALADKVIYTGAIDAYFGYKLGTLEYRSVRFENELLDMPNFQGNAAVNYTDAETPWTRIIEHKWFEFGKDDDGNDLPKTVISREYSSEWKPGDEPYYPVNDEKNGALYAQYKELAKKEPKVIFGGRLGEYKYYDMDAVIASALEMCEKELG